MPGSRRATPSGCSVPSPNEGHWTRRAPPVDRWHAGCMNGYRRVSEVRWNDFLENKKKSFSNKSLKLRFMTMYFFNLLFLFVFIGALSFQTSTDKTFFNTLLYDRLLRLRLTRMKSAYSALKLRRFYKRIICRWSGAPKCNMAKERRVVDGERAYWRGVAYTRTHHGILCSHIVSTIPHVDMWKVGWLSDWRTSDKSK